MFIFLSSIFPNLLYFSTFKINFSSEMTKAKPLQIWKKNNLKFQK